MLWKLADEFIVRFKSGGKKILVSFVKDSENFVKCQKLDTISKRNNINYCIFLLAFLIIFVYLKKHDFKSLIIVCALTFFKISLSYTTNMTNNSDFYITI